MAEKIVIHQSKLATLKEAATTVKTTLSTTLDSCRELISYVESSTWKGKSRDEFLTYIEIIYEHHKSFHEAAEMQVKALNDLQSNIDGFDNLSEAKGLKDV